MSVIVVDAGVVAAVLDARDARHPSAVAAVAAARERSDALVLPASAYAELLVAPSRVGVDRVATADRFLDAVPIRVEPASRAVAARAATLKAKNRDALRLPDALVAATAEVLGADLILTTHPGWPKLKVPVEVLRRRPGLTVRRPGLTV